MSALIYVHNKRVAYSCTLAACEGRLTEGLELVNVGGSSKNCTLMIFIFQSIKVGVAFCLRSCTFTGEDSHLYSFVSEAIKIYFINIRYRFYNDS